MSLDRFCRACGLINLNKNLCDNIYETDVKLRFIECTAIEVNENDGLPSTLCDTCYNTLLISHEFKIKCIRSDVIFKKKLGLKRVCKNTIANSTHFEVTIKNEVDDQDITIDNLENEDENNKNDILINEDQTPSNNFSREVTEPQTIISDTPSKKKFFCPVDKCDKIFFSEKRREGHIRQHNGQKPAKCGQCEKEFMRFSVLKDHIEAVHENKQSYVCEYDNCGKTYAFKHTLTAHIKRIHTKETNPKKKMNHICEQCGKILTSSNALKNHLTIHTGDKPFKCTLCPTQFTAKNKLRIHMMRHKGIKNFTCPHCGLQKTTMQELKIHINYHTKEKSYPCVFCDAVFAANANRVRHVKIVHEGIKAYECSICQRSFGKKETLKHHFMTHTGEKPHVCSICNRRFIQIVALQTHMKVHNKNKS